MTNFMEGRRVLPSKIMLIMRLIIGILIASMMQVSASTLAQQITLNRKNATIESVFKEMRKQSGYDFFYDAKILPRDKKVDIQLAGADIQVALNTVLKDLPLAYSIEGKIIAVYKKSASIQLEDAQDEHIDVRGRVTDLEGNPLSGATVTVKGANTDYVTDQNGNFLIPNVNNRAVLQISYLGYHRKEVRATRNVGTIKLEVLEMYVDEVELKYATGYQNLAKERTAGSYAKPNLDVMRNRSSSVNILQRLDGLVPGLTVNNGVVAEPLLIRGLTSIKSSRAPLVVVDGVELQGVNIESINMQDVEDITVLKDAASASIWGAKAANGVIVITTKKGKSGQKIQFDYDGYYSFQGRPDRNYLNLMNGKQFIQTAKELFPLYKDYNPWSSVETTAPAAPHLGVQYAVDRGLLSQSQADAKLDSLSMLHNTDQIRQMIYRKGMTANHSLSASGGGEKYSFYGSMNYIGLKNSTPGDQDNRYKINLRQDFNLSQKLQLFFISDVSTTQTGTTNMRNLTGSEETGFTPISRSTVPYQMLVDSYGRPLKVNYMGGYSDTQRLDYQDRSLVNLDFVPLDEINRGYAKGTGLSARLVGGGKVKLYKGLRFEGTYGYNVSSSNNRFVLDQESYMVRNELMRFTSVSSTSATPIYNLPKDGGRLTENNSLVKNWTVRNQLLYDLDWDDVHQLTLLAGQEATSTTPLATRVISRGWDDQLQISRPVDYKMLAQGISGTVTGNKATLGEGNVFGGEGIISRTTSYYSNLNYSYLRKYTLNASWRVDQSNLFGLNKSAQNRPVYSVGGKWIMGREQFMADASWINNLDLRFTYGVTGNAPTPGTASSYDILKAVSGVNYVNGAGVIISSPANDRLTWESTRVYNGGVDFGFLSGRLSGSIDGYIKNTQDLIGVLNTAPLTGFPGVTGNYGNMTNKGIDLNLNSINIANKDFFWHTGFTLGFNKNTITKLARTTPFSTGGQLTDENFFVGYPAFHLFAYNYAGLDAEGQPQIKLVDGSLSTDIDASRPEDMVAIGTYQPVWSGGLSNNLQYKNVQLSFNISYNAGHKMFRDGNLFWGGVMYDNGVHPEFVNRWRNPGDELHTDIPKYEGSSDENANRQPLYYHYGHTNTFNASYIKLRDITLSYSLPDQTVVRLGAKAVSFRFQLNNIMLWKANKLGIDPEFHHPHGGREMRTGQGQFTVGAHITL